MATLEQMGVQLYLPQIDVTDEQAMTTLFAQLRDTTRSFPPLRGIIHAAGILEREASAGSAWADSAAILAPKIAGSWHLHNLTQTLALDFFVLFSSASALLGLTGHGDYAAANAFLDALAAYRQQLDQPALSISWGDWAEVGMVAKARSDQRHTLAKPLQVSEGIVALLHLLDRQGHIGVMQINWQRFVDLMQAHRVFLANCVGEAQPSQAEMTTQAAAAKPTDLRSQLAQTPIAERPAWLTADHPGARA